jgi:WD40 repeat protein
VWDIGQARELTTFPAHRQRIRDLTFDATGQRLITVGEDRTVRVWKVESWGQEYVLSGEPGKVLSMAALSNERLATACSDNVIRIWDLGQRELISQLRGHQGSVVALDSNDRWLVSGSFDATVKIWPLEEMERAMATLEKQRAAQLTEAPADAATRPTSIEPID